jgi:RND superfamily putative drug exporter
VYVGGQTALADDMASQLNSKLPLFVLAVVALSFLLLMVVFRSVLIPATAAAMNLLSAGAAFGVITAVFQHDVLGSVVGIPGTGPISPLAPILMFAVLFGLSMDYEVFLVSRMHEEWLRTRDNDKAVNRGQAITGRTITALATIMVCVFLAFVLSTDRTIKLIGLGMATAILLDALIVRTVLVPAIMHTLGRRNWQLPDWLDQRLPHLDIEGEMIETVDHDIEGELIETPTIDHERTVPAQV